MLAPDARGAVPIRRSLLFVPASRPDRFPKALATGADAVCLDLEDGVAFDAKDDARVDALQMLANRPTASAEVVLRINDPKTELGRVDLEALRGQATWPDALMVPKSQGPGEIHLVERALGAQAPALPLIVLIESARAVEAATAIGGASPNVSALFFGAIDYAADVGCAVDWEAELYARSRVVVAAAANGLGAIDAPFMDVPAMDALADECRRARRHGFGGKAAIHPSQVSVIHRAFAPTDEEIAWARKVIAAYEGSPDGVLLVDGQLVERPVVASARRTLQAAHDANARGHGR